MHALLNTWHEIGFDKLKQDSFLLDRLIAFKTFIRRSNVIFIVPNSTYYYL